MGEGGALVVDLQAPQWLLAGVLLAAYFWWVALTRRGEVALPVPLLRAGLKSAVALSLALALAQPTLVREHRDVQIVAAVDVSDSMTDAVLVAAGRDLEALRGWADRSGRARALRVLRFAGDVEELGEPQAGRAALGRLGGTAGRQTDLAQALGVGLGLFDPETIPRLVLWSDGRATRGDARAAAERARARGIPLYYKSPAASDRQDAAVTRLEAPLRVRPHAAFELDATVLATGQGQARVRLSRDGVTEDEQSAKLVAGANHIKFTSRVESPRPVVYRVELLDASPNGPTDNDAALTVITPARQPRALLMDQDGDGAAVVQALRAQSVEVERASLDRLTAEGTNGLEGVDLVILAGRGVAAAQAPHAARLRGFVEAGGGLLVAFGPGTGRGGAGADGALGQLLPLRPDPLALRQEPSLALGLVIDRSGSMSGPKMELTKEAARGTAELLAAQDLITVVVFDSQPQTVLPLQEASNRQRILSALSQIRASGGTNILPGLRDAVEQLLPARAKKKHVIVLSDGQSPSEGILDLIEEAASARITVSAVGVGDGADLALLQSIAARGRGRFYHARDPATIPRIFSRETTEVVRTTAAEQPAPLRPARRAEVLSGLDFGAAPPLSGHTRMSARRDAEILIETPEHQPLLARAPFGLGQTAAWASDLDARWSARLARWPQFPKLWSQVARGLMREGAAADATLELILHEGHVLVRLDARAALPAGAGQSLTGEVSIVDAPATARALGDLPRPRADAPLVERAPGLYEAQVEAGDAGALLATARLRRGDEGVGPPVLEVHGRLSLPPSPELVPELPAAAGEARPDPLAPLAARTGGRRLEDLVALVEPGPSRRTIPVPLRGPVALAALALFLAEVGIRRARFRAPRTRQGRGPDKKNSSGRGAAW